MGRGGWSNHTAAQWNEKVRELIGEGGGDIKSLDILSINILYVSNLHLSLTPFYLKSNKTQGHVSQTQDEGDGSSAPSFPHLG